MPTIYINHSRLSAGYVSYTNRYFPPETENKKIKIINNSNSKIQIMKKHLSILLILLCPLYVFNQTVEVTGELKITEMDTVNTENHLVVKQPDGTLATRMVASLPPPPADTTRTLERDFLLTSTLCNCPNLPPAMIKSLLDNGYSAQDLLDFQLTVADLFNAGLSPMDLFNGGVSIDSLYGQAYAGGLIFYLDTLDVHPSFEGVVLATVDQSADAEWGCNLTPIPGADGIVIGTGNQNTIDIEAGCTTPDIAADICANLDLNGFMDWVLPSKDELNEMYFKIGPGAASPNTNVGGFAADIYWSSTEVSVNLAWLQNFNNGVQQTVNKSGINNVRAVRAF